MRDMRLPVHAFDEKHEQYGPPISVKPKGDDENVESTRLYWANGSYRSKNPMGELVDADILTPLERAKNQVLYYGELFRRAKLRFDRLKSDLGERSNAALVQGLPAPPATSLNELKLLKGAVASARVDLKKYQDIVEQLMPFHFKARERERSESIAANQEFMHQLKAIEI